MKNIFGFALLLTCVSCAGGPSKEDMQNMEGRINATIAQKMAEEDRKITGMDTKYATVMQLEQKTNKAVGEIAANSALLAKAADQMIRILEAQKTALKDQLNTIDTILKELKQ